jgi:hypothetical protein
MLEAIQAGGVFSEVRADDVTAVAQPRTNRGDGKDESTAGATRTAARTKGARMTKIGVNNNACGAGDEK